MANVIKVTENSKTYNGTDEAEEFISYNGGSNVTINAGGGDDTIIGGYYSSRLNGGAGNDYISSYGAPNTINGGAGDDTIYHAGGVIEYAEGDGNDVISGYPLHNIHLLSGTVDEITVNNPGRKNADTIIKIGTGSIRIPNAYDKLINIEDANGEVKNFTYNGNTIIDVIYNADSYKTINGTSSDDYIYNNSYYSTINASTGNDIIRLYSNSTHSFINYASGDGDDTIYNFSIYDTLNVTSGTISSIYSSNGGVIVKVGSGSINLQSGHNKPINIIDSSGNTSTFVFDGKNTLNASIVDSIDYEGTEGNDLIYNSYYTATINAAGGNDTIYNQSNYSSIIAGDGDDFIDDNYSKSTIVGGKGNDTIKNSYGTILYAEGDGDDVIINSRRSTLQVTEGAIDSATRSGNDVVLKIGSGSVTYKNFWGLINIKNPDGTEASAFVNSDHAFTNMTYNHTNNIQVDGTDNGDCIYNDGTNVTIKSGEGDDTIINNDNSEATTVIDSGNGDNYIVNRDNYNSIKSGNGNDVIDIEYSDNTINAGAGDDTINIDRSEGWHNVIVYAEGDGNDVINVDNNSYYDGFDNILLLDNDTTIDDYSLSGSTHVFTIGTGSITINNVDPYYSIDKIAKFEVRTPKTGGYNYYRYINGKLFNDIPASLGDDYYYDNADIMGTSDDDYIEASWYNVTLNGNVGDDYMMTNRLQDSSLVGGAGNDTIFATVIKNSTISGGAGNDKIQVSGYKLNSNNSINAGNGDDLIEYQAAKVTYNHTYTSDDETITYSTTYKYGKGVTIVGGKGNDTIRNTFLNMPDDYSKTMGWNNAEDDVYGETITGHLQSPSTYVTTYSYFNNWSSGRQTVKNTNTSVLIYERVIQYAEGDGNDVVEDYHETDTIHIINDPKYTMETIGNDVLINVGEGSIKLLSAKGKNIFIGDPKDNPYVDNDNNDTVKPEPTLDKVTITNKDKSPYTATSMVGTIDGSQRTKAITINANSHNNSIVGGSGKNVINGGDGNDTIIGGKSADKLSGDTGNDILNGGKGNDTLTGGAGSDTFFYADGDGKDVIADYVAGEDVIKLTSGSITKATASKGDLTLTIGKGSIKLKSGVGKRIKVTDSSDNILFNQSFGDKTIKVTNSDADTINSAIDAVAVTIDSSERTTAVDLIANAKSNYIKMGAANETITTGKGKDTIEYNGGNKVITDYTAGQDKLKLSVDLTNATVSENDVVLTTSSGTITLKDAKGKKITVIDKDGGISSQVYGEKVITITNSDGNAFKAMVGVEVLDASKRSSSKPITLTANDEGTTLIGGKGKDTLIGGACADTFVYTKGGNVDLIKNYAADDVIKLGAKTSVTDASVSGNDFILTIGGKKLTVEGGASTGVTVLNDSNIKMVFTDNSRTTKAFAELIEDNNFTTEDLNSIINNESAININYKFNDDDKFVSNEKNIPLTQNKSNESF